MPKSTYKPGLLRYVFDPFENVEIKSKQLKAEAMDEVADYIKEAILSFVGEGKSPVSGYGSFKALSKDYKAFKSEHSGSTDPNLELFGDMLDALEVRTSKDGIVVEITDKDQAEKADGHNQLTGRENPVVSLPMRRFIPAADENFNRLIQRGIDQILSKYEANDK